MEEFQNVSVAKRANIYFGGKVTSRIIIFGNGDKKTLGIMMPGEYEFNTALKEVMEITEGLLDVKLPGSSEWQTFVSGESFEVPANSKFSLIVKDTTDYCCSYISE
ncbi:MAG: pyrimidine/purine nucleoside phosphorylase [Syntrophomonas sp.]